MSEKLFCSLVTYLVHTSEKERKLLRTIVEGAGKIRGKDFDYFTRDLAKFVHGWKPPVILEKVGVRDVNATKGGERFKTPCGIFDYRVYLDAPKKVTRISGVEIQKTSAGVYRPVHVKTHVEAFESLGKLEDMCFTPGQIIEFCKQHEYELIYAQGNHWELHFLFREGNEVLKDRSNVFVAKAYRSYYDPDEDYPEENPGGWKEDLHLRRFNLSDQYDGGVGPKALFVIPEVSQ